MPNWATTWVTFLGEEARLKELKDKNEDFDLNKIVPEPEGLGEDDWYDWRIENWGTKWNVEKEDNRWEGMTVRITTPWNPPYQALKKLSEQYPDIRMDVRWLEENDEYLTTKEYTSKWTLIAGVESNYRTPRRWEWHYVPEERFSLWKSIKGLFKKKEKPDDTPTNDELPF